MRERGQRPREKQGHGGQSTKECTCRTAQGEGRPGGPPEMANTHPGTHEARGSSFTGDTLGNKEGYVREGSFSVPQSGRSSPRTGLEAELGCGPRHSRPPGAPGALLPLPPGQQKRSSLLNCRFKEPCTHLVTWFSTFTWGTRRARKSLEGKVTCISQGVSPLPQPSREPQHGDHREASSPCPPRESAQPR